MASLLRLSTAAFEDMIESVIQQYYVDLSHKNQNNKFQLK